MKYFLILGIVCLSFSLADGQSKNYIPIPVLKESNKVDSLLDIILKLKKSEGRTEKPSNSACLSIYLLKVNDNYFPFQVEENTNGVINDVINQLARNGASFGCFEYKKYQIFVWTSNSYYNFFTKTTDTKTFDFIYQSSTTDLSRVGFLNIWHYKYENGSFSEEGPPPAKN